MVGRSRLTSQTGRGISKNPKRKLTKSMNETSGQENNNNSTNTQMFVQPPLYAAQEESEKVSACDITFNRDRTAATSSFLFLFLECIRWSHSTHARPAFTSGTSLTISLVWVTMDGQGLLDRQYAPPLTDPVARALMYYRYFIRALIKTALGKQKFL